MPSHSPAAKDNGISKGRSSYAMVLVLVLLLVGTVRLNAANRYSVAIGNWNALTTWSATSGGGAGASVPVAGDVVFIENGNNVTVTANAACASVSFTATGSTTTLTISSGITLNISAALTIPRGTGSGVNTVAVGGGILNAGSISFTNGGGAVRHLLTISTGTVTVSGNVTQAGSNGSASVTFTGSGLLRLGGTFLTAATGTLTAGTGTVDYYAATAQTVGDFTYNNLTLSGGGVKTTATVTVNGVLSMEGTATASVAPSYGTTASLHYNTAIPRNASFEWITPFAATGGVTIENTGTITLNLAKVFNASVPFVINSGANFATAGLQMSFGGNFTNLGGTFTAGSSPIVITNTVAQSIAGFTTTGAVSMTKTAGTATLQGNITAGALTLSGAGTLNLGTGLSHIFNGALNISTGTLNSTTGSLSVTGSWTNAGTFNAGTGTVILNGSAVQNISGASASNFYNLSISNAAGVTLGRAIPVSGTLTLSNGTITSTTTNLLSITNTSVSAISGGSTTSFINGPVNWALVAGQSYVFPVGKGSTYMPFGLSGVSGTNPTIRVEAFLANASGTATSPLVSLSTTEYWQTSLISGTYTGGSVSLTRQSALNLLNVVGRNTTTLAGAYTSMNGTVSGNGVINADNTGGSLGYFLLAYQISISTAAISPTSFCQGMALSVPFTKLGTFNAGNVFTAQLSNDVGSFASPVNIGSLTSVNAGTISATIPAAQAAGSGYRIRVIASNPVVTGSDNGVNLSVVVFPAITGTSPGSRCGNGTVVLTATASAGSTINWYANSSGGSTLGSGSPFTTPLITATTTYYAEATNGGCTAIARVAVLASVIPSASITAGGGGTYCEGSNITLTSTGINTNNIYWRGPDSYYSLSQNPVIPNATALMNGTYTATGSSLTGVNLVTNGDFELGIVDFTSDYTPSLPVYNGLWSEGVYDVVADPHSRHPNYIACGDHTTGTGLQLVVNGSIVAGESVWTQTVNVVAGTDYQFEYWQQSVVGSNPSQLQLYANGSPVGIIYTASPTTCEWIKFIYNWNSGSNTTVTLSLANQNTISSGNDFALDDIVFQQVCDATASVVISVNVPTPGTIGISQTICQGGTPVAFSSLTDGTGAGTITYEWQSDASGSFVTILNETNATYLPPNLAATASYQRRTLAVSGGASCYSAYTSAVTITPSTLFAVAGGPSSICQPAIPSAYSLSGASVGGGASTAAWSIISGGGSLSSTAQTANPSAITYTGAVNYNGVVVLRLTTNTISGCAATSDRTLTITQLPVADFSYTGSPYCSDGIDPLPTFSVGGVAGTFSSTSGLNFVNTATGEIDLLNSVAGTYSVTNTISAIGSCPVVSASSGITITALPLATISYDGSPYCKSEVLLQSVTLTGTTGGSFSAIPAGLTINAGSGAITPATSTANNYTVSYTIAAAAGCGQVTETAIVTITAIPTATITYGGTPYCSSLATPQAVTLNGTGAYSGGAFSADPGLNLDEGSGDITPLSSAEGSYVVTYTIPATDGCAEVAVNSSVSITILPVATFVYPGGSYCISASNPSPAFVGAGIAGTFSSTAGLVFVSTATGEINIAASTAGTYTVTNLIPAGSGCTQVSATTNITITAYPTATISYAGSPYYTSVLTAQNVTLVGMNGGVFSATPAGLTLNASTGAITPNTSTIGSYTVTYTIAAAGGCGEVVASTGVTIINGYTINVAGSNAADGNYASLTNAGGAFLAINGQNQSSRTIIVTISGDSPFETGTNSLNAGLWSSLTLYPTVSGATIGGSYAGPLINLNGADNVTIDGRVNATGSSKDLTITNTSTSTTASTSTLRFINDATNNTVKYCVIKGSEMRTSSGILFFSTTTATLGNSSNTIDNNDITNAGGNNPINALYSAGTAGFANSGNTISNNNFFDFLHNGSASNGINLQANNSAWTISGNSFYETGTHTPTAAVAYIAIQINSTTGVNFNVSNNFIGGSAANCGGTPWTKTSANNNIFTGINLSVGTATSSNVQNNTIQNISWSNSGNAAWTAINVAAGAVNIGTTGGNIIGAASGNASIAFSAGATGVIFCGINIASTATVDCQNNIIGAIRTTNGNAGFATHFYGINKTNTAGTTTISNNHIGSDITANSIESASLSTANAQNVFGILNAGTGTITIRLNTIKNLKNSTSNATVANAGRICGIVATAGILTVSDNVVGNLTNSNANTATNNTASVCGIALSGTTGLKTISGNTIYNLSNTFAGFAGNVTGMYFIGNTAGNTVSGNFINGLTVTGATSTTANIYGIKIASGATTYANNIISIGGDSRTTVFGIFETGAAGNNNNLYFNTVYISGNLTTGSTNRSYAFYSAVTTNTRNFRNNVFVNTRSTVAGASLHYAAWFNYAVNTNLTLNNNDYYVNGIGGVLGYYNTANRTTLPIVTGRDVNSTSLDPVFNMAGGTAAVNYKIGINLIGVSGTGITLDFGGITRLTPSMGAWERGINKWKGSISNDWNLSTNWTENVVPAVDANIVFDDAPANHCQLDQNRSVTDITNAQAAYRMVTNGFTLTIKGNLNFSNGAQLDASASGSMLTFSGSSAQSIPAGALYNNEVFNLDINNALHLGFNGSLRLLNTLTATTGRLDATTNNPELVYAGSAVQTIEAATLLNDRAYNLTIDNGSGVSLNTSFTVNNNLLINAGKTFSIAAGNSLTVSGSLTNNAGNAGMLLLSDATGTASLMHNSSNVPATMKRYISGAAEDWHFLSSPVSNQPMNGSWLPSGTYGNGTGYDLYSWNEPTSCWIYQLDLSSAVNWSTIHPGGNFQTGRGYLYSVQALNPTKEFAGSLNNGSLTYPVTAGSTTASLKGFTLLGNPYPSSIDWQAASGWSRGMLTNSGSGYDMWIWNPAANNYGVCNSASGSGTNSVTRYIAPMQAFFVQASTAGNLGMDNSIRLHTGSGNWFKETAGNPGVVSAIVESADEKGFDEVRLQFGNITNDGGAKKLFSTVTAAPSLYLPTADMAFSIRYLSDTIDNPSVPLMFKAGKDGNYTLNINFNIEDFEIVMLEDIQQHCIQNLKAKNTYSFNASTSDNASRFVLHFGADSRATYNELPARIFNDRDQLVIDLSLIAKDCRMYVYDALGRILLQGTVQAESTQRFSLMLKSQIIIVRLENPQGTISRKLYFNNENQ